MYPHPKSPLAPRSPRIFALALALCLGLVSGAAPATAQESIAGGGPEPAANQVLPRRPTFPDQAYILQTGQLQTETGYAAVFESEVDTLHIWDIYAAMSVADLVEIQLGWDVINAAGGDLGVGDLRLGVKGGFFGGIDEHTALAGLFEVELPTASSPFGLGSGVAFAGGVVATTKAASVQLDFQATADMHLFVDDPTFLIPLAVGMTWPAIDPLRIYADVVVALDLRDFSRTRTSLLGGLGWRIISQLELNTGVRVGLSTTVPDVVLEAGIAWLIGDFF